MIAENLGERMSKTAAENATTEIRKGFSSQLGADVQTAALTKTPDALVIKERPIDLVPTGLYTLAIILVTQLLNLLPILRRKPRELLIE